MSIHTVKFDKPVTFTDHIGLSFVKLDKPDELGPEQSLDVNFTTPCDSGAWACTGTTIDTTGSGSLTVPTSSEWAIIPSMGAAQGSLIEFVIDVISGDTSLVYFGDTPIIELDNLPIGVNTVRAVLPAPTNGTDWAVSNNAVGGSVVYNSVSIREVIAAYTQETVTDAYITSSTPSGSDVIAYNVDWVAAGFAEPIIGDKVEYNYTGSIVVTEPYFRMRGDSSINIPLDLTGIQNLDGRIEVTIQRDEVADGKRRYMFTSENENFNLSYNGSTGLNVANIFDATVLAQHSNPASNNEEVWSIAWTGGAGNPVTFTIGNIPDTTINNGLEAGTYFLLGSRDGTSRFFSGYLKNVRIYNVKSGGAPVHEWKINDESNTIIDTGSASPAHGTLTPGTGEWVATGRYGSYRDPSGTYLLADNIALENCLNVFKASEQPNCLMFWPCNETFGSRMTESVSGGYFDASVFSECYPNRSDFLSYEVPYAVNINVIESLGYYSLMENGSLPTFDCSKVFINLAVFKATNAPRLKFPIPGTKPLQDKDNNCEVINTSSGTFSLSFDDKLHAAIGSDVTAGQPGTVSKALVQDETYIAYVMYEPSTNTLSTKVYTTDMVEYDGTSDILGTQVLGFIVPHNGVLLRGGAIYTWQAYQFDTVPTDLLEGLTDIMNNALINIKNGYLPWSQ